MAQLTVYLPDDIENRARQAAKTKGQSVSRWIAEQVVHNLTNSWPKPVLDAAGAIPEFPSREEIRAGYGKNILRGSME